MFNVSCNLLTETIPEEITHCEALSEIRVHSNALHGHLPTGIFNLHRLETLWAQNNNLTGEVDVEGAIKLPHLKILWLHQNHLENTHEALEKLKKARPAVNCSL